MFTVTCWAIPFTSNRQTEAKQNLLGDEDKTLTIINIITAIIINVFVNRPIWKFSKLSNSGIYLNWSIIGEVTTRSTTAYFLPTLYTTTL